MRQLSRRAILGFALVPLAGCGIGRQRSEAQVGTMSFAAARAPLYAGETPALREKINKWADHYAVPRELFHKVIQRESDYRADALNRAGPYYGLMQILPATARSMGHQGPARELLDAETNLKYAGRYLRGAWLVSGGDMDAAVMWYARGYYYEAKRLGLLEETGLR
jgi:soluble lytic murein transglycosylase-like protein